MTYWDSSEISHFEVKCNYCQGEAYWRGFLSRTNERPRWINVERCRKCGKAWTYARSGKRVRSKFAERAIKGVNPPVPFPKDLPRMGIWTISN